MKIFRNWWVTWWQTASFFKHISVQLKAKQARDQQTDGHFTRTGAVAEVTHFFGDYFSLLFY